MKYRYARVSTADQTPALQLAALKKAECKTVFKDDGLSCAPASPYQQRAMQLINSITL
jgi:Enterobacteriaceae phage serine recombinase